MSDMNAWRQGLRERIAIREEIDRINAKSIRSSFEEMVESDIYKSGSFDYNKSWKEHVQSYWDERLR